MKKISKKITFVITCLDYGGREIQLTRLASHLSHQGWSINVVSMMQPQAFVDILEQNNILVETLNMPKGFPDLRAIPKLVKILERDQPTILHSHLVHANLLSRITRAFVKIPLQISTSGNIYEGGLWRGIGYKLTDLWCDKTTNVSKLAVERYIEIGAVPPNKIAYIPNGVDTTIFTPDSLQREEYRKQLFLSGKFIWLAVGRLEKQKNYPCLFEAFAQISKRFPNAQLLICGKGTLEEQLISLANKLGLSEKITFLGVRKDISNIMNAADACVMSSSWEGMPGALLEASATGLPIVATNVSGNSEVVLDTISGFLVEKDNSAELSHAMAKVMALSNKERKQLGLAGRQHIVENFSYQKIALLWEKLYADCLLEKRIVLES